MNRSLRKWATQAAERGRRLWWDSHDRRPVERGGLSVFENVLAGHLQEDDVMLVNGFEMTVTGLKRYENLIMVYHRVSQDNARRCSIMPSDVKVLVRKRGEE